MDPDIGDLPFAVVLKLRLLRLSFGQHGDDSIIFPSEFSELDVLGEPVFWGRGVFGSNNLGEYPDEKYGIICQYDGGKEVRIRDEILGRVFNSRETDYSFAQVYAEDENRAQVEIFLIPDIFDKMYAAKQTVTFQLVTSIREHEKIEKDQLKERRRNPNNIVVEGNPGLISTTSKFNLDIGEEEYGFWWFRVRLVSLNFPDFEDT